MDTGLPVSRYQFLAALRDGVVEWRLALETDDGRRHELRLRDGEEVPILMELFKNDRSTYFDAGGAVLRSGWNFPGGKSDR